MSTKKRHLGRGLDALLGASDLAEGIDTGAGEATSENNLREIPVDLILILARFLGLRVAAISTITNMAAGMSDENISHEHTKAMAPLGAAKLEKILRRYLRSS